MRVAASLRERMNKQIEEIKRERGEKKKAEVAQEDLQAILADRSNQNAILIHTSCCHAHQSSFQCFPPKQSKI